MGMFGLKGTIQLASGVNGVVTLSPGSRLLKVLAHSSSLGASVSIFGFAPTPIPNAADWFRLDETTATFVAPTANPTIVFVLTDSFLVQYIGPAGAS